MGSGPSRVPVQARDEYQDVCGELRELVGQREDAAAKWVATPERVQAVHRYVQKTSENAVTKAKLPDACDATADVIVRGISQQLSSYELGDALVAMDVVSLLVRECTVGDPFLPLLGGDVLMGLFARAVAGDAAVLAKVQEAFFGLYSGHAALRAALRHCAEQPLRDHANDKDSTDFGGVSSALRMLLPIYKGLRAPLKAQHLQQTLHGVLVPLARSTVVGGVDTPSPMDIYVEPLIDCITALLSKVDADEEAEATAGVFRALFKIYDPTKPHQCANLLGVLVPLADALDGDSFASIHQPLLKLISASCGSDHSYLAHRGLQMWRSDSVLTLARRKEAVVLQYMAPALARHGHVHWDAAVATALLSAWAVLEELSDSSKKALHAAVLEQLRGDEAALVAYRSGLEEKKLDAQSKLKELAEARGKRDTHETRLAVARKAKRRMDLVFGKVLGKGAYSTVRFAKVIETDVPSELWSEFAVKQISNMLVAEQHCEAAVEREVAVHKDLAKRGGAVPGIATLYHQLNDGTDTFLVLDFFTGGDLYDIAIATNAVADQRTLFWLQHVLLEVATALHTVHEAGWYYGDVKPENVLLSSTGHAALSDFGAAMPLEQARQSEVFSGTVDYAAPELLAQMLNRGPIADGIDPAAADWWAFGCLAVQLLTGNLPFTISEEDAPPQDLSPVEVFAKLHASDDARAYLLESVASEKVPAFVSKLLSLDPAERPSFEELKGDKFFTGIEAFTDQRPPPPPKLEAASSVATKHSGRKESMMWRQVFVNKKTLVNAQSGADLAKLVLDEEDEGCEQLWPGGHGRSLGAAAAPVEDFVDPLEEFITKMPK